MNEVKGGLTRREFIKGAAMGAASVSILGEKALSAPPAPKTPDRPNILFIHTDQQHFGAISSLGSRDVHTPNMDRLVKRGVTFTQSYSANPFCCPARASWYTGRASSEHGVVSNSHQIRPEIPDLGGWFRENGYETFYSGKWHVPGRPHPTQFTSFTWEPSGQGEHTDPMVSKSAQAFLRNYDGSSPFFLSLGFLQPHDCCYWTFANPLDPGKCPLPSIEHKLPELPANFESVQEEAKAVRDHFGDLRNWTERWSPMFWRYYMWNYYRMVEMVDAEIGRVLDALEGSDFAQNTLVIFTSDHGDGLARRKLIQKWFLYDEAARVPLVVIPPGGSGGRMDSTHVTSGLDIAPTLCDYAGIPQMPKQRGLSLRPLVEGSDARWREFIVSEATLTGRMVRTSDYKLITYKDDPVVQLFDMRRDPWEMHNLARDPKHAGTVTQMKEQLRQWESRLEVAPEVGTFSPYA